MVNQTARKAAFTLTLLAAVALLRNRLAALASYWQLTSESVSLVTVDLVLQLVLWACAAQAARLAIEFVFFRKFGSEAQAVGAPKLVKDILVLGVYSAAVLLVIHVVFHQPIDGLWITSGALAVALGIALRTIILDLFSGIAVNIEKPYRIGDWIEIHQRFASASVVGQVTDISWRATHVRTEENTNVVIPNSLMTTMAMTTNFWHASMPTRYEVNVTLDTSVPVARVKRILGAACAEASRHAGFVPDRPARVLIGNIDDLGVSYRVRYWITPWKDISPSTARDVVYEAILRHLDATGLSLAHAKEAVFLSEPPPRMLDPDRIADRCQLVARLPLFAMLNEAEVERLARCLRPKTFRAGAAIVEQEAPGSSMFLVVEGLLDVIVRDDETVARVATLSPSDFFGEMSLLTGAPRSATVTSVTDSLTYELGHADFRELLLGRDEIVEQIAANVAERRMQNAERLVEARDLRAQQTMVVESRSLVQRIRQFLLSGSGQARAAAV